MSLHYGASPEEWGWWDLVLGLGDDLLPVVCQPGLPIAPTSTLTTYGKVPSRFDAGGLVVGFPGWTRYHAKAHDLETWPQDDRLGICLQTRYVRAIDVDIEDADASGRVLNLIRDYLNQTAGVVLPLRSRANSHKFLLLFAMEGAYAKQVLNTEHGIIEFLATGQQCVISGCHPSGSYYDWAGGLPQSIPVLSSGQFSTLKDALRSAVGTADWTEGRLRKARTGEVTPAVHDPVVEYLHQKGWVRT